MRNSKRLAKEKYYKKEFASAKNDCKKVWQLSNEITGRKSQTEQIGEINGVTSNQKKAEMFNKFFTSIAPDLAKNIRPSKKNFKDYLPPKPVCELQFSEMSEQQIIKIIKSMANKRSFSHDTVSNKMIKYTQLSIAKPLTHLINLSLKLNHIPKDWKTAKIVPIYKNDDKTSPNNYRPISLLPTISKVLEKVVANQVHSYLSFNKLLTSNQFGFRPKHSTEHLLIKIQNYIFKCKQANDHCLAVFIDLKKAFDTVKTETLIEKIRHYGLPHEWFRDYLSNRAQYVHIEGENSDELEISCGVPQGSILGPLLFLIYINDLPNATKFLTLLYADDTTFLAKHKSLSQLYTHTNKMLLEAEEWFSANQLTLHPKKTRYILFTKKTQATTEQLLLCGAKIERIHELGTEKSFKLVGVHIDEQLSWKYHIKHLSNKITQTIIMLTRSKNYIPKNIKLMIYNALIQSYLEYCLPIWGGAQNQYMKPLQVAQRKALRIILNKKYNSHTDPLFFESKVLKLTDLYELKISLLAKQFFLGALPPGLEGCFTSRPATALNTRANETALLKEPKAPTDCLRRMATYKTPHIWNNIAAEWDSVLKTHTGHLKYLLTSKSLMEYSSFKCNIKSCDSC